jgi:type IV conjugative transfer system protein TraE
MESSHLILETKKILKQRNLAVIACAVLLISNLFLSSAVIFGDKETVLVPNSLNQEASIINGKMSPAYVEALTRDVVNLMLNITPANVEYATKSILKITHPKFYGHLKTALNDRSKDVINRRISVYFSPQSITPTQDQNGVFVVGKLSTYLGKEEVSSEEKTYSITYVFEGFKPLVLDFHEVDPKAISGGADEKIVN